MVLRTLPKRFEPIKFYIAVLLVSCGLLLCGVLVANQIMDKGLEQFTESQSRYHIICDVSLIISKNISAMQGSFQHMLLASSPGDLKVAEERILESSKRVLNALNFLEKGGSFSDDFKVNFEDREHVAHRFTLDNPPENVVLASMELRTSLSMLDEMVIEYNDFAKKNLETEQHYLSVETGGMVLMHKKLAPFFRRMEEHSNRFYIESMRSLELSRVARSRKKRQNLTFLLSSSILAMGLIVTVGILVTRSASKVLNERREAQANLLETNELLEERIKERTAELAKSSQRLQDIALTSGDIIWQFDDKGYFSYISGNTSQILNLQEEEMIGLCFEDLRYPNREGSEALGWLGTRFQERKPIIDFVFPMKVRNEKRMASLLINAIPLGEQDDFEGYFGVAKDISEKREYETRLRLLGKVFDTSLEGITITDASGTIVLVNPAFTTITGYSPEEAIGANPRILKSEHHTEEFYETMWNSLAVEGLWTGEIWNRRKSGEAYPEWLSITSVTNNMGEIQNYVGVFHDITAMKQKEEEILHMAYHDALTGLPNRTMLLEKFGVALMESETSFQRYATLFIDLDNFKVINDSLGHEAGDELLKAVARRLRSWSGPMIWLPGWGVMSLFFLFPSGLIIQ